MTRNTHTAAKIAGQGAVSAIYAKRRRLSEGLEQQNYQFKDIKDDVPPGKRVSLFNLQHNGCRWPCGDPRDADFGYCGRQADGGKGYCKQHEHRARVK